MRPSTQPNEPHDPPTLTTTEAAEYLGISVSTLRRWMADHPGSCPIYFQTLGGHYRFRISDLEDFLRAMEG